MILTGSMPWAPPGADRISPRTVPVEVKGNPDCPVCGGAIRAADAGYLCLACLRVDGDTQDDLATALRDTDDAVPEQRRLERADHAKKLERAAEALKKGWKRDERRKLEARQAS